MSWRPNLNKSTKIAIIGGVFALAAAIIGVAVPQIVSHWGRQADLEILDITPVLIGSMPALDILIKNKSDVPNGISHLQVSFGQSGLPLAIMGSTTYLLNGSLDITTGEIRGFTKRTETPPLNKEPSRPFTGKLTIPNAGGWSIDVGTSVRDEVSPNSHLSIIFVLPVEMKIVPSKPGFYEFPGMNIGKLIKQYISEGPDKGFAFAKFISECGNVGVNIEVTYAHGRITKKGRVLAFQPQ